MVDAELWLLETAATHLLGLRSLVHPEIEMLLNKPGHGLERTALSELLERLNREGDIFIEHGDCRTRLYSAAELWGLLRPTRPHDGPCYGLTEKGGARWEKAAGADWSRYVSELWGNMQETASEDALLWEGEIACADPERLDEWIAVRFPAFGQQILPGTGKREIVAPWKATYWKTLPAGHQVTCKAVHNNWRCNRSLGYTPDFDVWYRSA